MLLRFLIGNQVSKIKRGIFRRETYVGCASLLIGGFQNRKQALGAFREEQSYEKGFTDHYNQYLKQYVSDFEVQRLHALERASMRMRIVFPFMLLFIFGSMYFISLQTTPQGTENAFKFSFLVGMMSGIAAIVFVGTPLWNYKSDIKSKVFPNILSFLGDYRYSAVFPNVSMYEYDDWGIVPSYDLEHNEDLIKGEYKGVGIELWESHLQEEHRGKNGNRYYTTEFKGLVIKLDVHKSFKGKTVVRKDGGKLGNWVYGKWAGKHQGQKLERVTLEDPHFEEMFEVYGSDQIEARYLLTTSFMDRLLDLAALFGVQKGIECSFYQDKLLMMIPLKQDLFEPGSIFKPEDFVDDAKKLLREMHMIFSIIDVLKLDQNIGM